MVQEDPGQGALLRRVWSDPDAAPANYLRVTADLHAGRTPCNLSSLELPVKELGNKFLAYEMEPVSSGQIGARWFEDCRRVVRQFAKSVGVSRPAMSLTAADFQRYRRLLVTEGLRGSRGLGVHALTRTITVVRGLFKWAVDTGLDSSLRESATSGNGLPTSCRHGALRSARRRWNSGLEVTSVRPMSIRASTSPVDRNKLVGMERNRRRTSGSAILCRLTSTK